MAHNGSNQTGLQIIVTTMVAHDHKDMSLRALNLVVSMHLQPFEGVYNKCIYAG